MIVAGRLARTANGVKLPVELAEALEAPVNVQRNRINFPSAHPLHNTGSLGNSDVILALEVEQHLHADPSHVAHQPDRHRLTGQADPQRRQDSQHLEPGAVPAFELSGFCALQRSGHAIAGDCGHQAHADINAAENIRQGRCKEAEREVVQNRLLGFVSLQSAFSRSHKTSPLGEGGLLLD